LCNTFGDMQEGPGESSIKEKSSCPEKAKGKNGKRFKREDQEAFAPSLHEREEKRKEDETTSRCTFPDSQTETLHGKRECRTSDLKASLP